MPLVLVNWNVWVFNKDTETIIRFIAEQNADVVCLQEVSAPLLVELKRRTAYHIFTARDAYHRSNGDRTPSFLVILTRRRVVGADAVRFRKQKKRTFLARFLGIEEGLEFHYADIVSESGRHLRIFNVHLECITSPRRRILQFREVCRRLDSGVNIVCGDLNVLRVWYGFFLRLILGSWKELWEREHEFFAHVFKENNFLNIFEGEVTHDFTGDQLDYVLVPKEMKIISQCVFPNPHGSDHKPMRVEIGI
ncbi:MAG: endonuclease/exonuclease/phosphatase family protein [Parcubacteria group bacterium]|nr:endonuclease/exonuclease/phosphatase family protein [Parcubacteria group bacterium]